MSIKYIKEIKEAPPVDVIIPAAGIGKRMKSYGPKPLIMVKNKSIIERQLKIIRDFYPEGRTILVCGFNAQNLMDNTDKAIIKIENENYHKNNVARSIGMGLRCCINDAMVVYGDLVFNKESIKCLDCTRSSVLVGEEIMQSDSIGCIVNNQGFLENMMYGLNNKWGQIAFFKGLELRLLKNYCWDRENDNLFGFEIMNMIVSNGGKIKACSSNESRIMDVDCSKDLEKVKNI